MSLHATEAGWMHAGHLVAHAATQHHGPLVADDGPRKWRMGTYDNWKPFQKDNRLTLLLSDQAVALVLTPPRLSHVFNFLDVHLHGQQKILHGSDTQRDMRNPHLREFFKTATGQDKAGSQYLVLFNLWSRITEHFNDPRFANGYRRDWFKTGYGLSPYTSKPEEDQHFLSDVFGYKIGDDIKSCAPSYRRTMDGIRVDSLSTTALELTSSTMMKGRKRFLKGFSTWTKAAILQVQSNCEKHNALHHTDPRPEFLARCRKDAATFVEHAKLKFGINNFQTTSFSLQKRIMLYLSTSQEVRHFIEADTKRADIMEDERRENRLKEATTMALSELDTINTNQSIKSQVKMALESETAEDLIEEKRQSYLRTKGAASVVMLDSILRGIGLSTKGRKEDKFQRIVDELGQDTVKELIWRMIEQSTERRSADQLEHYKPGELIPVELSHVRDRIQAFSNPSFSLPNNCRCTR